MPSPPEAMFARLPKAVAITDEIEVETTVFENAADKPVGQRLARSPQLRR